MINELRLEVQNMEEEARRYKTNVGKALESVSSDAANLSKTTEETLVQLETLRQKVHQELQQREACRRKAKEAAEKSTPAQQAPIRASMQWWEFTKHSTSYHDADRTSKTTTAINGCTVQHICC